MHLASRKRGLFCHSPLTECGIVNRSDAGVFSVRADLSEQSIPFVLQLAPNGSPVVVTEATGRADLQLFASPSRPNWTKHSRN